MPANIFRFWRFFGFSIEESYVAQYIYTMNRVSKMVPPKREILKDILEKKPEIYKVTEDTVGIFLTIEAREKLGKSLAEVLTRLRKELKTIDLCVGSVDYHSNLKVPQKWYERAQYALSEATKAGPNNYKLLVEKS